MLFQTRILNAQPQLDFVEPQDDTNKPVIGNLTLGEAVKISPKLAAHVLSISSNLKILEEYEIPLPHSITKQVLSVFRLNPRTLEWRLKKLHKFNVFNILKHDDKALEFVGKRYCISRLDYIANKNLNLMLSMKILLKKSENEFKDAVDEVSYKRKISGNEYITYLSKALSVDEQTVSLLLKNSRYYSRVPFSRPKLMLDFLQKSGYRNDQIIFGLPLVLYPLPVINKYIKSLSSRPELQPFSKWKDHDRLLHLLLYIIEKDHDYSGLAMLSDGSDEFCKFCLDVR